MKGKKKRPPGGNFSLFVIGKTMGAARTAQRSSAHRPKPQKQRRCDGLGEWCPAALRWLIGKVRFPNIIPGTGLPILQVARFLQFVIGCIRSGRWRKNELCSRDLHQRLGSERIGRPGLGSISHVRHAIVSAGRAPGRSARSPLCRQIWLTPTPGETESNAIRSCRPRCQIAERHLLQHLPGGSLQRQRLPLIA